MKGKLSVKDSINCITIVVCHQIVKLIDAHSNLPQFQVLHKCHQSVTDMLYDILNSCVIYLYSVLFFASCVSICKVNDTDQTVSDQTAVLQFEAFVNR